MRFALHLIALTAFVAGCSLVTHGVGSPTVPPTHGVLPLRLDPDVWYGPKASIVPIGGSTLSGTASLRPDGAGNYILDIVTRSPDRDVATLSGTVVSGQCAGLSAGVHPTVAQLPPRTGGGFWSWQLLGIQDGTLGEHAAVAITASSNPASVGCSDLPVAEARALKPIGQGRTSSFRAGLNWHVTGHLRLWPTSQGDHLLRAEANGPTYELSGGGAGGGELLWHLVQGDCRAWIDASKHLRNPEGLQVVARFNYPPDTPNSQTFSLVIPSGATGRTLALAAFVQGGGPLVTCATLPAIG